MEHKLLQVFDRQRFQQNERLAGIIGEVESRYAHVLSDDDLEMVSAAGDNTVPMMNPELMPDRHDVRADKKDNKS